MKKKNQAIPLLASLLLSKGLFAQSVTSSYNDLETQKLNGQPAAGSTGLQPYMPSTQGPGSTDPDSGLVPQQPVIGPVPLKTNGSRQASTNNPASNATLPVLIPNTGKIESDNQVDGSVKLMSHSINSGSEASLNLPPSSISEPLLTGPNSTLPETSVEILNWYDDASIYSGNEAYIIENMAETVKGSASSVKFDLWIRGAAAAVVEIYDANGKRINYKVAEGHKHSADILGDMYDQFIRAKGSWGKQSGDPRQPAVSNKTELNFTIPAGGSFRVTKSSQLASGVNYALIAIEALRQLEIPIEATDSVFMNSLVDKLTKKFFIGAEVSVKKEYTAKELLYEIVSDAFNVAKDVGLSKVDDYAKKLTKSGVGLSAKVAELTALALQTDTVIRDLERSVDGLNDLIVKNNPIDQDTNQIKAARDQKTGEIAKKEEVIRKKQEALNEKNKELVNAEKYKTIYRENTASGYDQKKLAYLQQAQKLVDKYRNKSTNEWSRNDKTLLDILAKKIGTSQGTLYHQLRLGNFDLLRDKFASSSAESTVVEQTYENLDYKNIQADIDSLTSEIKALNQQLTLDKMQQSDLIISANTLQDVTNTIKVTETQNNANSLSSHAPYWSGLYTANYYEENNLGQPGSTGYRVGPAETREQAPGPGTNLYLRDPQNFSVDKTITLSGSQAQYFGSYNYVAWGAWSDASATNKVYASHWVVVDKVELDRGQAPRSGTANYQGTVQGTLWTIGQDNSFHNADGTISMQANFGTNAVSGDLQINNADTHTPFASASFSTNMDTSSDGLTFQGTLTGTNGSVLSNQASDIRGDFGGNQAAEVGGAWSVTTGSGQNGDGRATGVFRASKQ